MHLRDAFAVCCHPWSMLNRKTDFVKIFVCEAGSAVFAGNFRQNNSVFSVLYPLLTDSRNAFCDVNGHIWVCVNAAGVVNRDRVVRVFNAFAVFDFYSRVEVYFTHTHFNFRKQFS